MDLTIDKIRDGIAVLLMEKWALEAALLAANARIAELEAASAGPEPTDEEVSHDAGSNQCQ